MNTTGEYVYSVRWEYTGTDSRVMRSFIPDHVTINEYAPILVEGKSRARKCQFVLLNSSCPSLAHCNQH